MATGRLGYVVGGLTQNTLTNPYFVPANTYSVFNISITNTASTSCQIRIALSTATVAGSINQGEYIEYGTTVIGNGVFERTGLVAGSAGGNNIYVWVYTTGATGTVNCTVYGIETSTT